MGGSQVPHLISFPDQVGWGTWLGGRGQLLKETICGAYRFFGDPCVRCMYANVTPMQLLLLYRGEGGRGCELSGWGGVC